MKAYLIFIEGMNAPTRIHATRGDAEKEGNRLAKNYPGKEILVLKVQKRLKANIDGLIINLGSHVPEKPYLTTKHLVEGKELYSRPILKLKTKN